MASFSLSDFHVYRVSLYPLRALISLQQGSLLLHGPGRCPPGQRFFSCSQPLGLSYQLPASSRG